MATQQLPRIDVERRAKVGSRYAARLRQAGRLPLVIYGHGQPPLHVSCDGKALLHILHEKAHVLEAQVDGQAEPVLVKEVQWDHLGTQVVHVDLERVDLHERVTVEVDLVLVGEAVGLKETGAILERPVTQIEIECLVTQIPDSIKVDVSELKVDEAITVADLKLPEGVTTTLEDETVLVQISQIEEEVVEAVPAEAGAQEPEVIGRKAEEGEEGEPAAGAEKKPAAEKK